MNSHIAPEIFSIAKQYIFSNGRSLDQALFSYYFENGSKDAVLDELSLLQNEDGGFQNTGEGPAHFSSPIATSVAFQHLIELNIDSSSPIVKNGIRYFINTYNKQLHMWQPAANWVHEGEYQFQHWANPSAEIIGYLCHYCDLVEKEFLDHLLVHVDNHITHATRPLDPFNLFCYLRLSNFVSSPLREKLVSILLEDVPQIIEKNESRWSSWCIKPYWFAKDPMHPITSPIKSDILLSLDYELTQLMRYGYIPLHWQADEQETLNWRSMLTLEVLRGLHHFHSEIILMEATKNE